MALCFVSPTMLRNPSLWRQVLAVTSLRNRRTLTFNNYGMAVASQVGNLKWSQRKIPSLKQKEKDPRDQMCFSCILGKHHSQPKLMGFSFKLDLSVQILFLQKLKNVWRLFHCGKKSVFASLKHLEEHCSFPGDQWCPGLLVCSSACFLCGKMLTDIQIIRSININTHASGRPSWCLVCSWPFILLAENED